MKTEIFVNTVIEWTNENSEQVLLERVLWLDLLEDIVIVISLYDPAALPVCKKYSDLEDALTQGAAIKKTIDPLEKTIKTGLNLSEKHINTRDRAWKIIVNIVVKEPEIYNESRRWAFVQETADKFKTHPQTVYKYLRRYWKGGKTKDALLPDYWNCGGAGMQKMTDQNTQKRGRKLKTLKVDDDLKGINIDEDIKKIFIAAIRLFYNNSEFKPPLSHVYQEMIGKFFNAGFRLEHGVQIPVLPPVSELPSKGQFIYWFHKLSDVKKSLTAREGRRGYALRHRELLGNATARAYGPGSIYEIDATIGDVFLVNRLRRSMLIGRPIIYLVVDVFSRLIAGIYVGLEGPSWTGAMMALANAMSDKVSFCERFGVKITEDEWPARYLCESIYADRGEMISMNSSRLVDSLNISISNTPPYRADLKPIVEQSFRILNLESIHWIPGAVKDRTRERGTRDYRLDGILDLEQFTSIIINNVLAYNNSHWVKDYPFDQFMMQQEVEPIPVKLWNWGIKNRSGHLREKASDLIKLSLLPRDDVAVTAHGLKFKRLFYTCERAVREQWFIKARNKKSWKEPICYDPRKLDTIYLLGTEGKTIEACNLLDKSSESRGFYFEEIMDLKEINEIKGDMHRTEKLQTYAEMSARNDVVISKAQRMTESAIPKGMSDRSRIINLREHRTDEKEKNRKSEAWDLNDTPELGMKNKILKMIQAEKNSTEDAPDYDPMDSKKKKNLEMLRKNRLEQK